MQLYHQGSILHLFTSRAWRTNLLPTVKYWVKVDDAMDVFAEHAVGGMIGLMANAIFGADYIVGLDGVTTGSTNPTTGTGIGGWVIHNYRQFYIQLAYVCAATAYAFVMSAILVYGVHLILGLPLRASAEVELMGMGRRLARRVRVRLCRGEAGLPGLDTVKRRTQGKGRRCADA